MPTVLISYASSPATFYLLAGCCKEIVMWNPFALWNPVKHVKDDWCGASIWRKMAVVVFYGFIWLFILANFYQSFVPLSLGYDCSVTGSNKAGDAWIEAYIRQWSLGMVFLGLYIEKVGLFISNVTTVLVMSMIMGFGFMSSSPIIKATGGGDCYDAIMETTWMFTAPLVLTLAGLIADKYSASTTSGERMPLVS
jgi:hypothetical protein